MEPPKVTVRKITAAWKADSWYIDKGVVYVTFNGVNIGFDLTACGLPDWSPDQPLNIILEIPCPPSPSTKATTT